MLEPEPVKKFLTDRDVAKRYSIGRSTVWYFVKIGRLPAPIKISERITRWELDLLESFETESRNEG